MQWPDDEKAAEVQQDLQPLFDMFPDGELSVPDGLFDEGAAAPLSNGTVHALPWEFVATAPVRRRGAEVDPRSFTIRGVTIVHDETQTFRRYVDWAAVWAQLGISSGRGESDERAAVDETKDRLVRDQRFLDPSGVDVTEQLLGGGEPLD